MRLEIRRTTKLFTLLFVGFLSSSCGGSEVDLSETEDAICDGCVLSGATLRPNLTSTIELHNCAGSATFKMLNTGHASAGGFWAYLYPDALSTAHLSHWVPSLAAGASVTFTDTFAPTRAKLMVYADATYLVIESNENDNSASSLCP